MAKAGFGAILAAACIAVGLAVGARPAQAIMPETADLASDPDYRDAVRLLANGDYARARTLFEQLRVTQPNAPELLTGLGFAYRKMKDYPASKRYYDAALAQRPDYLPALEYQGEWFIETGDIAAARANLERLERLCGRCHEWRDLAESLARAEGRPPPR